MTVKKNVVSVRLDDEAFQKLQDVQDKLKDNLGLSVSYAAIFNSLIHLSHKALEDVKAEEIHAFIRTVLSSESNQA